MEEVCELCRIMIKPKARGRAARGPHSPQAAGFARRRTPRLFVIRTHSQPSASENLVHSLKSARM